MQHLGTMKNLTIVLATAALATGCLTAGGAGRGGSLTRAEQRAVLECLNNPHTTVETLDHDARLDARAARAIIEHRNGLDGWHGSEDDRPFENESEIDALRHVGARSLRALVEHVRAEGLLSSAEVTVSGVLFRADEVDEVLALVNSAPAFELDQHARLDRRAARHIVEARPFADLDSLDAVPWVGPSALARLQEYAAR